MPKKQSAHNQDYWEEIFETIDMDFFPIEYIHTLVVTFDTDDVWEIDLSQEKDSESIDAEQALDNFFQEYEDSIVSVDFRLDFDRVKKDITKRTHRFLKLNK